MKRVVITGIGVVSPIGCGARRFRESLLAGICGVDCITRYDAAGERVSLAAEVKDFDGRTAFSDPSDAKKADRFTQFAMAAALEAMNDSGITVADPYRFGVYSGSGIGGMETFMTQDAVCRERGMSRVSPFFVPMMIVNMASGMIAIRFGAKGATLPVVTACATSTNSVGEAYRAIKHGYADAIIAGGAEATINRLAMAGFTNMHALSESSDPARASIPFDRERGGFVMGEGASELILEELDHARARGARIYAEVCGYGNTCDAYHMTSPSPDAEGAARAIELCMTEAGIAPCDAGRVYFNAHGTGTQLNDRAETVAVKKAFGEHARSLAMSSTKSMTGHMLGAAGATELVACVAALETGMIPPTVGYSVPDPECDLDCTPNKAARRDPEYTLSTSLGFGGHNACVALKKYSA